MKSILLKPFLLLLFLIVYRTGHAQQVLTKFGDNVATLDGIMKAFYDVVTVKPGGKISYQRDSLLHIPGARAGQVMADKQGKTHLEYNTLKVWHQISDPSIEKTGFWERETARRVEKYGGVYHVWSTYESRLTAGGKVIDRGINSIELYFDGTRFWIITWVFDNERAGNPLPAEYQH